MNIFFRMLAVNTGYVLTIDPDPNDTIYNRLQYLHQICFRPDKKN